MILFYMPCLELRAGKIQKGYDALKVYNYFKAKEIFEKSIKKQPLPAAYGLSIIYSRSDNPFTNIDSANRYILLCLREFESAGLKERTGLLAYQISQASIDSLNEIITRKAFELYKSKNDIASWNKFIREYPLPLFCFRAIDLRDSLVYTDVRQKNTNAAYKEFIKNYPFSKYLIEATDQFDLTLYTESTPRKTIKEYEIFLSQNPGSPYKDEAENQLYQLAAGHGGIPEIYDFIRTYPKNHNVDAAWRRIYLVYTANYTASVIENFKKQFPDYPFKETIEIDILLSRKKLYPVRENEKWGFMDSTGVNEIKCKYDWVEHFSEGLAECNLADRSGFIDKTGKITVPFIYEEVEAFQNGLAICKKDKYGIINRKGETIVPFRYDEISAYSDGFAIIEKGGKYGYVNESGAVKIPVIYSLAGNFSEGLAFIELKGLRGFINHNGTLVIPCKYDWVSNFKDGLAKVKSLEKFGLINKNGTVILPCEYDLLGELIENRIMIVKDKKYGFADRTGRIVIPVQYDYSDHFKLPAVFKNGYVVTEKNKKQGLIDSLGKEIIPKNFDRIEPLSEGLAAIQKKGKWGYIDSTSKMKIPCTFQTAFSFKKGLARVSKKDRIGFINQKGKVMIDFAYQEATDFTAFGKDWSIVTRNNKLGIIDKDGVEIISCEADDIQKEDDHLLRIEKNSKIGYYDLLKGSYIWQEEGF